MRSCPVTEIRLPDTAGVCGADLALLVLGGARGSQASEDAQALAKPRWEPAEVGELVTALGYGSDGELFGVRRKSEPFAVECLGGDMEAYEPGVWRDCDCDADHSGTERCRSDGLEYLPCDCTSEAAGAGGAAGAGSAECVEESQSCERSGDCCSYPEGACVDFGDAPRCAASCEESAACDSGCCAVLDDYSGACADAVICGEDGACREDGVSCDESSDCRGFEADTANSYCLELDRGGPGVCSPRCDDGANCESECCLPLENGDSACLPAEDCA